MKDDNTAREIRNLANFVETACEHFGDKTAFVCGEDVLTYRDVEEKSRALASWFQHHTSLKPGDRVAIQLPNILGFPIAAFAALRAGLILVNTNPLYTQREMLHQFKDSGAKAIVIFTPLSRKLAAIIDETDISVVIHSHSEEFPTMMARHRVQQIDMGSILAGGGGMTLKPVNILPDDICMLQYTGGTTGLAKGACLTNYSVIYNMFQTAERLADTSDPGSELYVCPLPLYHIYAFSVNLILFFCQGNTNILIPNPRDLDSFVELIKPHKFTGFAGINTLFVGLCNHEGFKQLDFSELKLTLSGGTALVESARLAWKEVTGCSITEGYGMSETSPVISLNYPGEEHYGTVGPPLNGTQLEIWDVNNKSLPEGEVGEIVIKGDLVMQGYWNNPEETKNAISPDGYFKTGDMGRILEDGCIEIVDRLKDMVIVSGFNVYPSEVEHVLCSHGDVLEAAVIGVPDTQTGESVRAYITANPELDLAELTAYCRENLTPYKVPKEIVIVTELPKTAVGKILRKDLRAIAEKVAT
ncbi:AMP-binding protein [Enterovibrio coralii]|uniref:Long-chain-fatty-acid--CoA ligase n=1 Tax=Enterovibrio coralii TaxID=294935 RepID=A0A135I5P3_9GAMM|nr:AMP-binding protein [Enterovibrio coralii]KXF80704.1 long-chain fatty acid--CoA ligase [Enterovibrio coralii]